MAKPSRQQRRERRAQQEPALAGGPPPPRTPARPVARSGDSEPRRPREERETGRARGSFVRESWAELKKVEWPSQQAVISGTAVVLVACLIVGTYLWLNDQLWQYVVKHVLLR
jgi:preprotein translocase subunit SecE